MLRLILFLCCALPSVLFAQLNVNTTISAPALAKIIFPDANIHISNVTASGCDSSKGAFAATNTNLGLSEGVVLVSGNAMEAIGPNNASAGGNGMPCSQPFADVDIESILAPYIIAPQSFDASALEFDFYSDVDANISIPFVFGSEEYPAFLGFSYCDAVGIFISGPGIPKQNIALVPGTISPVGVDFINSGVYPELYVDNGEGVTPLVNTTIQFNGFTLPLMAHTSVIRHITYHIKIVVADVGDYGWDAGAFIGPATTTNTTGVTELTTAADIKLYPNPSNGIVNLSYQHVAAKSVVEVYDAGGRIAYSTQLQNTAGILQIPTSQLPQGMYYLKLISGTGNPVVKKFVVAN